MAERPNEPTPRAFARRLRARLPVSPLPWKWNSRQQQVALIAVIALLAGGALASVLIQRGSDSESAAAPALDAPAQIRQALKGMSLVQKADAVVVSGFETPAAALEQVDGSQIGGIIVGAEDWFGSFKGRTLLARIRAAGSTGGRIPPLIVGRQEGGIYRAYPDLPPVQGQREIAATGEPAQASSWALGTGRALDKAGFDLNLAPLADVATLDSPLADRVFSDDPAVVTSMTGAAVRGCRDSGIACATPYFPGLGGASQSTADGPATVSLDTASLAARDLAPFRAAIEQKVPAIVISLAFYAAYDPVTPAALSPSIAGKLLRVDLGFEGVALTDDLTAGAIGADLGGPPQAAVRALAAGSDLVVVDDGPQAIQAQAAILDAARSGGIPMARLDQAIARVLALKIRLGLVAKQAPKSKR
jgi:beta-N-acetylhexosaminidase